MKNKNAAISADGRYVTKEIRSALPIWAASAVWLIMALIAPMHSLIMIAVTAALSIAVGVYASKHITKETVTEELPFASGDPKLDAAVRSIDEACALLSRDADAARPFSLKAAKDMTDAAASLLLIRAELIKSPEQLKKLRRFFDYYLPTALKLSEKYALLQRENKRGENQSNTITATENALTHLNTAFRKQYDALFHDDSMDAEADLTVLETMIKQDNLD